MQATPAGLPRALLVSQIAAVGWWLVALWVRSHELIPVWHDQQHIFLRLVNHLDNPYSVPAFANPPWTAVLLAPFGLLPLSLAVLVQLCLYFAILAALVFRFGGGLGAVLLVLTSFLAFDSALELNIDWLVALGLLVPAAWSLPLLLVKPQVAAGYLLALRCADLVRAIVVMLVVGGVSLAVWGLWPPVMLRAAGQLTDVGHNIAPSHLLPAPLSWALGIGLAVWAFRRRDPVVAVLAGLCFAPYVAFYSLLIHFALAAARWPRVMALVSAALWTIYGGFLALALLRRGM